jgi:hypothetical protein
MKLQIRASLALSVLALVAALSGVSGAVAGKVLVGSKQIRNGSILTQDIRRNAVRTSDVQNGGITGTDVGAGEIEPVDVTMPDPDQIVRESVATVMAGSEYVQVGGAAGTYVKEDPASVLQVDWSGSASAKDLPCVFQLRVDGAAVPGAGEVPVSVGNPTSISTSALFEGLPAGEHSISVWARTVPGIYPQSRCTVGPEMADVAQTYVVSELVL